MTAVALPTDTAAPASEHSSSSPPPAPPELAMVARAVQRLVARNDAVAGADGRGAGGGMKAFEAAKGAPAPRIGVPEYLERVHRYAGLEPECYVVAYAYVDMAAHRRPAAAVASRNVHRLLLACLLVASKVLDDFHHSNAFFARVGGVSNAEMNKLELELLGVLDFAVAIDHRAYDRYREHLEKEMRRDYHGLPGAAPPKPRTTGAPIVKPLPPLVEEHPAEVADGDHEEHNRKVPNGVLAGDGRLEEHDSIVPPGKTSLRELWAFDY
ncbi:Cyclin-P1-1 [Dichanthelium oligosanthes]|uniref:Cyclin-P1-1 n=1 Tax=Dichanthelium oligosanthes TaxID=888268 RepID=A0A1E5WI16_9POAL|nr:Cyclin-P1-1 [Dichanthelium oligosanthes]